MFYHHPTPFRLCPPSRNWELIETVELLDLLKNKDYSDSQRLEMMAVLVDRNCKNINDHMEN